MQTPVGGSIDRTGHRRQRVADRRRRSAAAWYVRDSQQRSRRCIASNVASVQAAQELEISIREIHVQFDRYLITLDRKHLESVPRPAAAHGGGAGRGRDRGGDPCRNRR